MQNAKKFHCEDEVIWHQIVKTSGDSLIGFILEVDLKNPEELYDSHQDYPLAPTKETVIHKCLSL